MTEYNQDTSGVSFKGLLQPDESGITPPPPNLLYSIIGYAYNNDGIAKPGITISNGRLGQSGIASSITDTSGLYTLSSLLQGAHIVAPYVEYEQDPEYVKTFHEYYYHPEKDTVTITGIDSTGISISGPDFVVMDKYELSGTVLDSSGVGVAGISILFNEGYSRIIEVNSGLSILQEYDTDLYKPQYGKVTYNNNLLVANTYKHNTILLSSGLSIESRYGYNEPGNGIPGFSGTSIDWLILPTYAQYLTTDKYLITSMEASGITTNQVQEIQDSYPNFQESSWVLSGLSGTTICVYNVNPDYRYLTQQPEDIGKLQAFNRSKEEIYEQNISGLMSGLDIKNVVSLNSVANDEASISLYKLLFVMNNRLDFITNTSNEDLVMQKDS